MSLRKTTENCSQEPPKELTEDMEEYLFEKKILGDRNTELFIKLYFLSGKFLTYLNSRLVHRSVRHFAESQIQIEGMSNQGKVVCYKIKSKNFQLPLEDN